LARTFDRNCVGESNFSTWFFERAKKKRAEMNQSKPRILAGGYGRGRIGRLFTVEVRSKPLALASHFG
jgi:hypothetical protein